MQEIIFTIRYFYTIIKKLLKTSLNFILYTRSLLWVRLSEKGPGTSYQSLFESQNMHGEILFLGDLSDLGNFDD